MKKLITVTQEDLLNGECGNGESCPIALALKRMHYDEIFVGDDEVIIQDEQINLPDNAREFIQEFDNDGDFAPFSFELDFPVELL